MKPLSQFDGADRRQFGRRSTVWHAWVVVAGRPRQACIVRNVSPTGALLEFPDAPPEAHEFRLLIDTLGFEARCDVRHRNRNLIGVFFPRDAASDAINDHAATGNALVHQFRARA
jgi:PilZ domain